MKTLLTLALLLSSFVIPHSSFATPPNVLFIVADDLGYNDVGFHGSKDIPTPQLDALAERSVRCTSGYVTHPYCSPSRAGFMTGRYQHRFGHEFNPPWSLEDTKLGLPIDQITLPEVLRKSGSTTAHIGKWHLGAHPQFHPLKRGFEMNISMLGRYHDHFNNTKAKRPMALNRNGIDEPLQGYMTDALGAEAAAFVQKQAGATKPWFLYLAFTAPHTPLQVPEAWEKKFAHIADKDRRNYAALVAQMDEAIGKVLAQLDATKQRENTLICFISDNGGPLLGSHEGRGLSDFTDNSPLRGAKGQVFEGGIRVPFLVSWPARLKPGVYDQPVIALDFFATAVTQAGGTVPADRKMDGVNLIPHLTGESKSAPHDILYWRINGPNGTLAARMGNWKFVRPAQKPAELYNLASDIGEKKNLAAEKPEVLAKLDAAVNAWNKEMINPVFKAGAAPKGN